MNNFSLIFVNYENKGEYLRIKEMSEKKEAVPSIFSSITII